MRCSLPKLNPPGVNQPTPVGCAGLSSSLLSSTLPSSPLPFAPFTSPTVTSPPPASPLPSAPPRPSPSRSSSPPSSSLTYAPPSSCTLLSLPQLTPLMSVPVRIPPLMTLTVFPSPHLLLSSSPGIAKHVSPVSDLSEPPGSFYHVFWSQQYPQVASWGTPTVPGVALHPKSKEDPMPFQATPASPAFSSESGDTCIWSQLVLHQVLYHLLWSLLCGLFSCTFPTARGSVPRMHCLARGGAAVSSL